ncbi:MAG TPA: carboxymuconolactone decarboxylase family protein [Roseomonas sp.]
MTPRLNAFAAAPDMIKAMLALNDAVQAAGIERSLFELVKIRASQLNGCAFCLHMHTNEARAMGESEDRMHLLSAWRESPLYSARERAALGWTEALTLVADTCAPDTDYQSVKAEFTEKEQVVLTMMIVVINGWNRVAIGFRAIHAMTLAHAA